MLPGLCFSNELISRDEGLHTDFAIMLHNRLQDKVTGSASTRCSARPSSIECEFATEALPVSLIGMNAEAMQHLHQVRRRPPARPARLRPPSTTCRTPSTSWSASRCRTRPTSTRRRSPNTAVAGVGASQKTRPSPSTKTSKRSSNQGRQALAGTSRRSGGRIDFASQNWVHRLR